MDLQPKNDSLEESLTLTGGKIWYFPQNLSPLSIYWIQAEPLFYITIITVVRMKIKTAE